MSSGLDFEATGGSIVFLQLFAFRALSQCKHDMGALLWLNAETLEIAPAPLFDRLVRFSAHERSFVRLRYMINIQ